MTDRVVNISMCVTCPYFLDDSAGMDCLYCEKHFDDSFEGNSIPDWCELPKADTIPQWAIEAIKSMKNWAMRNPEYAAGFGDACDQILALRKHEDDYD